MTPTMMRRQTGDHAVVLGASMAGLLAARVLPETYRTVTVIDRDVLPAIGVHRRGVPHATTCMPCNHADVRCSRSRFPASPPVPCRPGRWTRHVAPDAVRASAAPSWHWPVRAICQPTIPGRSGARSDTGTPRHHLCGRHRHRWPEDHARPALSHRSHSVRDRRAAAADHGGSCRGRHRPWLAHADLVSRVGLPASGRGPDRHRVGLCDQDLAAASRGHRSRQVHRYRCHAGQPTDGRARCGGRWPAHLTLGGILGDYPPIDPAGFDAFVASLPFPDIAEAIERAEPLDDPVGFRFPASVRHRYERLREFPDGLLVIGDAVSSFNPGYGQGMTVAANQAMALRRLLAPRYQPLAAPVFPVDRQDGRPAMGHRSGRGSRLPRCAGHSYPQDPAGQRLYTPVARGSRTRRRAERSLRPGPGPDRQARGPAAARPRDEGVVDQPAPPGPTAVAAAPNPRVSR
jgi:hypothetical protein